MANNQKYNPEDILNSINNIERAEPNYFLLTRIQQRIKNNESGNLVPKGLKRILVPLYAVLVVFIILNMISYLHFNNQKKASPVQQQSSADAFAGEYDFETGVY